MTRPREIAPIEAQDLIRKGAVLVDIREGMELGAGVIPGAVHAPLSQLPRQQLDLSHHGGVVFHCKSGGRTSMNAVLLGEKAMGCEAYLLKGGIDAWRAAGLPVEKGKTGAWAVFLRALRRSGA